MCGISGIINTRGDSVDADAIGQINDLIAHRGPDDEGFFFGNTFALGHRRLSILDLSQEGHQPMHYKERYVITYNGEVYNYLEIAQELRDRGYSFCSQSDTEVILAAYDHWGAECVKRFNGMWAFALYDKQEETIFCSRDRFGIKPFYYAQAEALFVFGSEIKQILHLLGARKVNLGIAVDYLLSGLQEHTDETFFEGVRKLPAGHNLIYNLKTYTYVIAPFYALHVDPTLAALDASAATKRYREALERAVALRLRSDVTVGSCLSGGMDSSSVATIAARLHALECSMPFNAITAASLEKASDESAYAKLVADNAAMRWHVLQPTTQMFVSTIDEVIYTQEEPFGSPSIFMQYFVMQRAKELGCKVMLDGQGGDETLLGYEKYYPAAYLAYFKKEGLFKTLKEINHSRRNNAKMSWSKIAFYAIGSLCAGLRKRVHYRQADFLKKSYRTPLGILDTLAESYLDINALQTLEITRTNLPILLRYEDRNSMRHSVEARLPFIDYRTLETALGLNIAHKIHNGWSKYLLRKAMEPLLPSAIVWRKNKLGFNAPEATWLQAIEPQMLQSIERSALLGAITDMPRLKKRFATLEPRLKWRLFNIAKWEEIYDVRLD